MKKHYLNPEVFLIDCEEILTLKGSAEARKDSAIFDWQKG